MQDLEKSWKVGEVEGENEGEQGACGQEEEESEEAAEEGGGGEGEEQGGEGEGAGGEEEEEEEVEDSLRWTVATSQVPRPTSKSKWGWGTWQGHHLHS